MVAYICDLSYMGGYMGEGLQSEVSLRQKHEK
jgi:hypothetical protein